MINKPVTFLVLVFLFSGNQIYAQKVEELLFNKLCFEIYKQNEYYLIKEKVDGKVVLVEDPITGDQEVSYKSEDTFPVIEFRKRKKEEQLEILNAIEIPNLPLTDTILIIDSSGIFKLDILTKFGTKVFLRKNKDQINSGHSDIVANALVVRGNAFLISCSFPSSTMISLYYFNFANGDFIKDRLSYIYMDHPHFKR